MDNAHESIVSRMNGQHEALSKEFEQYAYSVSHDLSAPIRAMVEFSRLLEEEYSHTLDDNGQVYLDFITTNGKKLQDMMHGLLLYSRINTRAKPFATVDLNRVMDCACAEISMQNNVSLDISRDPLPEVYGDAEQLILLFANVLHNALHYHEPGVTPKVHVGCYLDGDECRIAVSDHGIGINPMFSKKIFGLFNRLHTDEEFSGVGMGLCLAEKVIARHNGRIWHEPREEGGSTFYFTLTKG